MARGSETIGYRLIENAEMPQVRTSIAQNVLDSKQILRRAIINKYFELKNR